MRIHWSLPLVLVAFSGQTLEARAVPEGPTLYRLEAGSTLQRGCLDPAFCDPPAAAPLYGTFVLTPRSADFATDLFSLSEIHWHDGFDREMLLFGSGLYAVRSPFGVFRVLSADLGGSLAGARFEGRADGAGDFGRFEMTISADLGPFDEARITLVAAPVRDEEVAWYRLQAASDYRMTTCGGALAGSSAVRGVLGLVPLRPGSAALAVVSLRGRAEGSTPAERFLTGFGTLDDHHLKLILGEDGLSPILLESSRESLLDEVKLEATLAGGLGCQGRELTLAGRRIAR